MEIQTLDIDLSTKQSGIIMTLTKDTFKPFPKQQILDSIKLSIKLKESADDNFQIGLKWWRVLQMGRKHCGKSRNCSLQAISPNPCLYKRPILQTYKNMGLFGKGSKH